MAYLHVEARNQWLIAHFRSDRLTDPLTVQAVTQELKGLIADATGRPNLVIDFDGVEAVSSQIIGLLIGVRDQIAKRSGKLVLSRLNAQAHKLMTLTKLDRQFTFADDIDLLAGPLVKNRGPQLVGAGAREISWVN